MSCHGPPSEDVDDDDREFLEAAQKDVALAANLLMCLSRRERFFPWWQPQESSPPAASPSTAAGNVVEFHRGLCNWGCRRWRSRGTVREGISAAKMENINRASPTTPLSWSGGSGTSGSVCEEGWGIHAPPQKRQMERSLHEHRDSSEAPDSAPERLKADFEEGAEMVEPSPSKRPKSDVCENEGEGRSPSSTWMYTKAGNEDGALRAFISQEPPAVRSSAVAAPNKEGAVAATDAVPASSIAAARVEPLRLRLAADAASRAAARRTGKKKTLPELKMMEESLLRDRAELQKTLLEQKKMLVALREENLKMTEWKQSDAAAEGRRGLLIDLNCMPEEEER